MAGFNKDLWSASCGTLSMHLWLCMWVVAYRMELQPAQELQPAGADALKDALAKLGLKCGGTLRQRAERLILTKSTPLEKLDRKLFAKGVVPAVRHPCHVPFHPQRAVSTACRWQISLSHC